MEKCRAIAAGTGATIDFSEDVDAVAGADAVYTDVWVSMGEPEEVWAQRIADLAPYQVNAAPDGQGRPPGGFHALPARLPRPQGPRWAATMGEKFGRDAMEVTDEVFTGGQSVVFREAENRMHTIKAVMPPPWARSSEGSLKEARRGWPCRGIRAWFSACARFLV